MWYYSIVRVIHKKMSITTPKLHKKNRVSTAPELVIQRQPIISTFNTESRFKTHGFFDRVNATGKPVTTYIIQECIAFFNSGYWSLYPLFLCTEMRVVLRGKHTEKTTFAANPCRNRRASIGARADIGSVCVMGGMVVRYLIQMRYGCNSRSWSCRDVLQPITVLRCDPQPQMRQQSETVMVGA